MRLTLASLVMVWTGVAACHRDQVRSDPDEPAAEAARTLSTAEEPPPLMRPTADAWTVLRVGGDPDVRVEERNGSFRVAGDRALLIDTPLPVGYPRPTPPGAIELKKYPAVRRAERTGSMAPDIGMNLAFFPLFNHIKSRDIAMTSPVEMDYGGTAGWGDGSAAMTGKVPGDWTMSFLYREPSNGPTGSERGVRVVDVPPVTVISVGVRGRYSWEKAREAIARLRQWLSENPSWSAAGDARSLYYNGPDRATRDLWAEVQIPVRPATEPIAAPARPESP